MKRLAMTILAAAAIAFAGSATAQQQDFSKVQVTTTDLGNHAYELAGLGGNMTLVVGGDGIILVDTEFAPLHDKIRAAIAAISPLPVKYIVNTHYHPDHTGGDAAFIKEGVTVIAQENVKKRMLAGTNNGPNGAKIAPVGADSVPTKTYRSGMLTLRVKGVAASAGHINNAHTDGDSYVWFRNANVLATGDIVALGRYPSIDTGNGGNIKGMIAGVGFYIMMVNDKTKVVPGHGPLTDKASLVAYHKFLIEARDRVAKLIKAGKSEQEAIAAHVFADWDAKYNANDQQSANFTRIVYESLKPPAKMI
jgi:glyoxylase-like metal-dependent hydrolase (beta-lactamase superfamily II)